MRILHVNKFFDFHGGAEVYLHELAERQQAQGHDVHVFATRKPGTPAHADERFSPKYHAYNEFEGPLEDAKKAVAYLWNREARQRFGQMLDEIKPDVIHLHNLYHHLSSSILAEIRQRKLPCVQTLHDYKLACPNYKMYTQGSVCERCKDGDYAQVIKFRCLGTSFAANALAVAEMHLTKATMAYEKTVQAFICPSQFMRDKMVEWGEPASKMVVAPNPTTMPAEPVTGGGGYVLSIGRLSAEKGVDLLIRGIAPVPMLPLLIIGRGPEEAKLKQLAADLGASHVQFLGFKHPSELPGYRARAEAMLLGTKMYENASGVILEGLASGLPCFATNVGGNPELIQHGETGWLLPPDDPAAWTEAFRAFQQLSPARRREMGKKGRAFINAGRTWERHLAQIEAMYQSVQPK